MTRQVNSASFRVRFGELGVRVEDGEITFQACLLRRQEFLEQDGALHYFDIDGDWKQLLLPSGSLAFTFCQEPVVYQFVEHTSGITVNPRGSSNLEFEGCRLEREMSQNIFRRDDRIERIDVRIPKNELAWQNECEDLSLNLCGFVPLVCPSHWDKNGKHSLEVVRRFALSGGFPLMYWNYRSLLAISSILSAVFCRLNGDILGVLRGFFN